MKKTALTIMMVMMMALVPITGFAADKTFEGSIQGFTCVTQGTTCPVGQEDPMAAVERVFVLLTADNNYYFVPNVDRAVLSRHINEKIQIRGEMNEKYKSIQAKEILAMNKGSWQKVWDPEGEFNLLRSLDPEYQKGGR